jgi:5-methylcytosine-specific restriction endonuclease McrA
LRRDEVFARDENRCVYCGGVFPVEELTVDHVQPRARGGDRSAGNLVTACRGCNTLKGHRRLAEFLAGSPAAHAHFVRHARFVWSRHLRAIEEEVRAIEGQRSEGGGGARERPRARRRGPTDPD